ncbi:isoquinoline 1-oxidoreductase, beta subunit [Sphingomonas laterariae]|uniref:Isoquinoline 1-oxidoreductase, beta subunit n=1 Tax=Edaphosphingomonas laterariae TaxID=861865 RepID=A0A239JUL5_9SPHN|nr:xanthine dehydrogenase family protein molybdopterin-binding subunit [Sphingomonas laterariae]SNT09626.1 isoquinoline 1-oxidoreductase, beta subunit [Sphingomonas laterariae]
MGIEDIRLSRRSAIGGAGALVIGLALPAAGRAQGAAKAARPIDPNAYVRIGSDDVVTVFVKHIEFGQGPYTGLATLVAEELDADWARVRAEAAGSNPAIYGNVSLGGIQGTGGSTAIASSYELMRRAGATARAMLVQAAAAEWNVPPAQISVEKGVIRHKASGRSGRFGEFAAAAAKLPAPQDVKLKDPKDFQLIGKTGVRKVDSADKTNGKAKFALDIQTPGMLTVVVARPPRFGAKIGSFDAADALKVRGVKAVKALPSGVAVYATGMWPALKGRSALKIQWDENGAEARGSEEMIAQFRAMAQKPGAVAAKTGDVDAALAAGGELVEAEYVFPFLAHAPMEPLDGYIEWDGKSALARFGSQIQTLDHAALAKALGVPMPQVKIETMLAGGSFGRRATAVAHFATELAEAAKAIGPGTPVKLVWTREDDIHGGYYRPLFVHRMRGAVKDGQVAAWANDIVGQSFAKGTPFEAMMVKDGVDFGMIEGAHQIPYDIPAFRCTVQDDPTPVTTLWWRSVGHTHTGYAVECFVDQLLEKAGKDPVAGRLAMMAKAPRAAGVLRAVAELARWNGPTAANGRARGVAVVESFNSYVAQIAEVSLDENGEPKVHKIWCAVDCGVAVNPDVVRAQAEGGIGYGLGHALYAEVPLVKGAAAVSNFNDYRSLRIMEMPEIEVVIVPSAEPPTGIGEPGVPPVAPAVANALARLGRQRPARLPMVRPA